MNEAERRLYIFELMNKFYTKMESIMQNPNSLNQEDGLGLIKQVNDILDEFDKLENTEGTEQYKVQFELVKHRLSQAMMTTPGNE